jgi:DNA-binding response OmpR family regulator
MSDFQVILFIGHPLHENLEFLMDGFRQDMMLTPLHCETLGSNFEAVTPFLDQSLPDLICLFADAIEENGEDVLAFCGQLRGQMDKHRPVLVVQSASPEERRIQYLIQGADDILGTELSSDELKIRLLVHLRRNLDFGANEITKLPGLQLATKIVQRRLNRSDNVALLSIELDHLDIYSEVYGELPTRQVLKTFAALLGHLVIMPDFISHTDENHFVIVTNPDKAEKISAMLCRQFETTAPNFYSEKDRKQGYMVSVISDNISRRVPLMSLSIGIVSTQTQPFHTFLALFNASQQMRTLARMQPGCSWQSDRLRLSSALETAPRHKPAILVLETDAALAYLLKLTLEMEGYDVDVVSGIEDARGILAEKAPAHRTNLVILDALIHSEEDGLTLADEIHQHYPAIKIICTSSLHNRQRVLQAGADLYLPKPFELSNLFSWIHRLLPEAGP